MEAVFDEDKIIFGREDYAPILGLENVEYLTVESRKEVKEIYDQLMKLPKLKYGMLIEHPELYRS